jgi:signal transduction histidine kinase
MQTRTRQVGGPPCGPFMFSGRTDRRARTLCEVVLDSLPDPVVVVDASASVVRINDATEHLFGYPRHEVLGQPLELLLPVLGASRDTFGRRRDGSTFLATVTDRNVEFERGPMRVLVVHDATDDQERVRRQENFFVDASHELRTPISIVWASAEVLLNILPADVPEGVRRMVTNLHRDAERLTTLMDDLLDLNRIRAGRLPLRLAACDLRSVVDQAARAMDLLALRRDQTLDIALPVTPIPVMLDKELFGRAVLNLVSNACKYGRQGGRVEVVVETGRDEALVSVSDDGPGIPAADRERVFQRFYRAATPDGRRVQGNGLGLPICRAAVELHGGLVWVDEAPGGGSLFRIMLPLREAQV